MYPEKGNTAKSAAAIFLKKMKRDPPDWGTAVLCAVENLENEKEQLDFLRWMADPTGKFRKKNADCKVVENSKELDLTNLKVSHGDCGKFPSYRLSVKKQISLEDESKQTEE